MQESVQQALALATDGGSISLKLEFNGKVAERGEKVEKDQVQSPPSLLLAGKASEPYIAIAIDVDAPYASVPFLSPIVHWIQPGLKSNGTGILEKQIPPVIDWLAPLPPPFSGPHRYIVTLYEQPADFDVDEWESRFVKPVGIPSRIRWNMDNFVKQAGLQTMLAANYFRN